MKIVNRRAKFDYQIIETYEAGISLTGAEVRAVKNGKVDISHAHIKIINNEILMINCVITSDNVEDLSRTRKILLHKNQIVSLASKVEAKKLTLVPVLVYNKGPLIKVRIALAKSKKKFEKKRVIKKRELEREAGREFRNKI